MRIKNSISSKPTSIASAISMVLLTLPAHAKEEPLYTLETIVLSASKVTETQKDSPVKVNVIEMKDLAPATTVAQVLERDSGLNVVQSGAMGQQTSIFTRGTNSSHTAVLVDGVKTNTATSSISSTQTLDTSDFDRVEIIKGASSVQYGTDAIGGVVNIVSRSPEKTGATLEYQGGEQSLHKVKAGVDLVHSTDTTKTFMQVSGNYVDTDGSPVNDSPKNKKDMSYSNKGGHARVGFESKHVDVEASHRLNEGSFQYLSGGVLSADFKNEVSQAKVKVRPTQNSELNLRYSNFKDTLDQNEPNYLGQFDTAQTDRDELEAFANVRLSNHILTVGVAQEDTKVNSISYGTKYNKNLESTGYYAQHKYDGERLKTQVGIREEDNKQFGKHTVYQGSAKYFLTDSLYAGANAGTGFRAPNGNDLYGYGGNPDLKAEESKSYETFIGKDFDLAGGLLNVEASYFTNDVDNLINSACVRNCTSSTPNVWPVYGNVNVDKAKIKGAELTTRWTDDNWNTSLSYTYLTAKDTVRDIDLSRRPNNSLTAQVGYDDGKYSASARLVAKDSSDNSAYDKVQVPGYVKVGVTAGYQVNPLLKAFMNIDNVTDTRTRVAYGSGAYYISEPRQITAGFKFKY